jgi:REP element-mobilizing transposase RayT
MPRKSRIDAPGAVHHIIVRGIERRSIFKDDHDRERFTDKLGSVLKDAGTACYAWVLMRNHVHLLLRSGRMPIAMVMRRLLTSYAMHFNRRYSLSKPDQFLSDRLCPEATKIGCELVVSQKTPGQVR